MQCVCVCVCVCYLCMYAGHSVLALTDTVIHDSPSSDMLPIEIELPTVGHNGVKHF